MPWLSGRLRRWGPVSVAALGFLTLAGAGGLFAHRTEFALYHLLLLKVRGDVAAQRTMQQFGTRFVPEDFRQFPSQGDSDRLEPRWAFRVSHAVPTYAVPVVDDTDGDGVPEVYVGSYSKNVSVLDGRTGKRLWQWELPFGVIGGAATLLVDLDRDGEKEVILGSHWSLPIRVYALRTAPRLSARERLKWVRNVSGDFVEGGLNVVEPDGQRYLAVGTRDALYSRGTLSLLDRDGRPVFRPIYGFDICLGRMGVGRLSASTRLSLVTGSHTVHGPRFGGRVTAWDLPQGQLLWMSPPVGDGGENLQQLVDIDFDGQIDVIAHVIDGTHQHRYVHLDGRTGRVVRSLPGAVFGVLPSERRVLFQDSKGVRLVDGNGRVLHEFPPLSFGIRSADDEQFRLVRFTYAGGELYGSVYRADTGALERQFRAPLEIPPHQPAADYGVFGPGGGSVEFKTLADVDGDGYWDALLLFRDYIVSVHTPLRVHPRYHPYAPLPYRNTTNAGFLYEFDGPPEVKHVRL
jgi:hypothetical protein